MTKFEFKEKNSESGDCKLSLQELLDIEFDEKKSKKNMNFYLRQNCQVEKKVDNLLFIDVDCKSQVDHEEPPSTPYFQDSEKGQSEYDLGNMEEQNKQEKQKKKQSFQLLSERKVHITEYKKVSLQYIEQSNIQQKKIKSLPNMK